MVGNTDDETFERVRAAGPAGGEQEGGRPRLLTEYPNAGTEDACAFGTRGKKQEGGGAGSPRHPSAPGQTGRNTTLKNHNPSRPGGFLPIGRRGRGNRPTAPPKSGT